MKSQYTWICPHCGSTHRSDGTTKLNDAEPMLCPVCRGTIKVAARYFCHKTKGCEGHFCLMLPAVKELKLQPFVCEVCGRQDFSSRFVAYQPDITLSDEVNDPGNGGNVVVIYNGAQIATLEPEKKISFGRGMAADIMLKDCDIRVSRVHFGLKMNKNGTVLLNVEGVNGVCVNKSEKIPKGSSVTIQRGDIINLYNRDIELK